MSWRFPPAPPAEFLDFLGGPFTATLTLPTISSTSSSSALFYYEDTAAGSPTVTASASEWGWATLPTTVSPGPLKTLKVSPVARDAGREAGPRRSPRRRLWLWQLREHQPFVGHQRCRAAAMSPGSGTSPLRLCKTTSSGNGLVSATRRQRHRECERDGTAPVDLSASL